MLPGPGPGGVATVEFIVSNPATGAAVNADSLPVGTLNRNGTDDGAVTVTVTNIDTGRYKAAFTVPATYLPTDTLNLSIAATVNSIVGKGVVMSDQVGYGYIQSGTATAGGASTITLQTALGADTLPVGALIAIVSGTGKFQTRVITAYVNSTRVVTVDHAWTTNPDNTSVYVILYGDFAALNSSLAVPIQLTAAQIATGVWQDATAGDFTVASSIGKSLYTAGVVPGAAGGIFIAGSNAATTVNFTGSLSGSVGSVTGNVGGTINGLTATALGNFFTVDSGQTYSTAVAGSVVKEIASNATITGGGGPTAAQIATAVWQDTTAGDFTVASSIGKSLAPAVLGTIPGAAGGIFIAGTNAATTITGSLTTTFTGNLTGSVGSVVGNVGGTINGLTSTALGNFFTVNSGQTYSTSISGSVVREIALHATVISGAPTAAAIATAVWTDTTGSDFTVLTSPGKIIFAQLGSAFTTTSSSIFTVAALQNAPTGGGTPPTAAEIATAVWTDTTGSDFTVASSPGKILVAQLGGAFTTTSSSIYTVSALQNAPTGGSAPTAAAIATQVWTDLTSSSDFSTVGSIGALLKADINAPIANIPTAAQNATAVWTDLLVSSDFSTSGSIGALLKADINAPIGSIPTTNPTAAQIATAVWTDTTGSDFTVLASPGKILVAQLGNAFTTTSSSVYTVSALQNAPTGGSAPSVAQIVTGVWTDLLASSDFSTAASIGALLKADINTPLTSVRLDMTQPVPRSNTAETVGDCLMGARVQAYGVWRIDTGALTLTLYASDGTTPLRVFNLDSLSAPSYRI